MLIYIFAEHYPNPYKPQFDTEFAFLLRQGHRIRIFASGKYTSTIHPRVREYGLDKKVSLFPTTLKTLPRFAATLISRVVLSPMSSYKVCRAVYCRSRSPKKNLLRITRALLLPTEQPHLCYIHNISTAEYIDFLAELYPGVPVVMYFHGGEVGGVQRVARDAELFGMMRTVFTNTHFSQGQAIARGCPPERVIPLHVGFDLSDYPCGNQKQYRPDGILRLISIGRLSEEKGLVFALQALSRLIDEGCKDIRYTIVGRGMQEVFLKDFVAQNQLNEYVSFVGEKNKAEVVELLGESDVLLLPSIVTDTWAETQAAVVQEAMFMRLLVIGTKAGGVPESTADVLKEFSVPVCDATSIAEAIKAILKLAEVEMEELGDHARVFAVDRFDINTIGRKFLEYTTGPETF